MCISYFYISLAKNWKLSIGVFQYELITDINNLNIYPFILYHTIRHLRHWTNIPVDVESG